MARLRNKLFHAIMQQEVAFFDSNRTGELVSRLGSDVTILKDAVTTNISMFLRSSATVLGGIAYLFVLNWRLALVLMGIVPLTAITAAVYGRYVRNLSKSTRKALAQATEVAEESLGAIRTVRSFAGEGRQEAAYGERIAETLALGIKTALAYGVFSGGMQGVTTLAFTGIVWYGGTLVLQGSLSVGTLTAFLLYAVQIGASLAMLSGLFGNLMQAVGANDRVFQILDREPSIPLSGGRKLDRQLMRGEVQLSRVNFAYPSRPDVPVLQDFNLTLSPGTVTALVGPSGGGKSTVVNLVEGFYHPSSGVVLVDGVDMRDLDGSWWRDQVGLVRQEPVLFSSSIAENIAYAVPDASEAAVQAAADVANAHQFISRFPDGYRTSTGERGVRLSGGQKQRVAIARAVIKDPLLCVFDEASSALDAESEAVVQGALDRLTRGRTVLVIAHRLSTVRDADRVVVVDGGRVVGQGTHDELLASNELYANLVARQLMPGTQEAGADVEAA